MALAFIPDFVHATYLTEEVMLDNMTMLLVDRPAKRNQDNTTNNPQLAHKTEYFLQLVLRKKTTTNPRAS